MIYLVWALLLTISLPGFINPAAAQHVTTSERAPLIPDLPDAYYQTLELLNVRDADLRDVLRGIAREYDLNVMVDNAIQKRITVRLSQLPVIDVLRFLARQNDLQLEANGAIMRVLRPPPKPEPPPPPPEVSVTEGMLSVHLQNDELKAVIRLIAEQSGQNIVMRPDLRGRLTGILRQVPFEIGLRTLLTNNGFVLRQNEGIYHVAQGNAGPEGNGAYQSFWLEVTDDSLLTLDVSNAPIQNVLSEISERTKINLITYAVPQGTITANVEQVTVDEVLNLLLKGTSVTYKKSGGIYMIGDKAAGGFTTSNLLRLEHIRADAVLALIPAKLKERATIQVVREHNGLMITGTSDAIFQVEQFVQSVDYPTPQILIEALVVDFEVTDLFDLGVSFGRDAATRSAENAQGYSFGDRAPVVDENGNVVQDGEELGGFRMGGGQDRLYDLLDLLNPFSNYFGVRNLGRLPEDFYFRLRALSQEGKVDIRSRPQIATLNGHTAKISIGTTQYYILRTNAPYGYYPPGGRGDPNDPGYYDRVTVNERFEKIEAKVQLEITPWVSSSGEVTVDIRPEFSTPVGDFDPQKPPAINSRVLESTVRLQDGETIILGGLIQESDRVTYNKVPILGDIPLIGELFRSRTHNERKSELVIFLTPHVFFGNGRDDAKWNALREDMDLETDDDTVRVGWTRIR